MGFLISLRKITAGFKLVYYLIRPTAYYSFVYIYGICYSLIVVFIPSVLYSRKIKAPEFPKLIKNPSPVDRYS